MEGGLRCEGWRCEVRGREGWGREEMKGGVRKMDGFHMPLTIRAHRPPTLAHT